MPLTDHEMAFLAAFLYEVTTEPFTGPATKRLHANGIAYTDITSLMTAYEREHPPTFDGNNLYWGKPDPDPPPCPWPDREAALRREEEIKREITGVVTRT